MRNDLKETDEERGKRLKEKPFVTAVKKFIQTFSDIAKAANVGRAIGLVDSKDWVIADLNSKIAGLETNQKPEKKQAEESDNATTA